VKGRIDKRSGNLSIEMEKAQEVFEAAVQAEEAGDSDRAIRLYEQCSLLAPRHFLARWRVAILLFNSGNWKEAIRVGRQASVNTQKRPFVNTSKPAIKK
jgi:tetratricopeptide (TPR) repeat protein